MKSLTSLIHDADPGDQLAVALQAVLDSGLILFSRDCDGRFVQLSEALSEQVGLVAPRGATQPPNMRVFNEEGRILAGTEYPASITRVSGKAQHNVRTQLVSDDNRSIWLQMSTMPLERGPEGWSVLTLGADVTELVEVREVAEQSAHARAALLRLAVALMGRQVNRDELVELLRDPMAELVPGADVSLATQHGNRYELTTVQQMHRTDRKPDGGRFTKALRERWEAPHAHVNLDVRETDIYGQKVVAEFENRIRSIVIAPSSRQDLSQIAALAATSDQPNAFNEAQIESLELTGRLIGAALNVGDAEQDVDLGTDLDLGERRSA